MYRVLTVIAMTGLMCVGTQAFAANSRNQVAMRRRQVVDCMSKRMSLNKSISYNEAAKACKDQMKRQNDHLVRSTPTK